jgi:hypothetical protein
MYTFDPLFLEKKLLFSQERDRQPIVKLYRHHDTVYIYGLISKNKYFHVVCIRESKKKALKKRLIGVVSKKESSLEET